jgi:hypothetical protein
MKKLFHVILMSIILSGCSALPDIAQLIRTPAPVPSPSETPTPFASATPIPTQDLFATSTSTPITFTPTVTALGAELFTPTNTETPVALPTVGLPIGPLDNAIFTPKNVGFTTVLISNNVIYWNEGPCNPRVIKISAFVEDFFNTDRVFLFMRLREKKNTLNVTEWGAGADMIRKENGSFNYEVGMENIRRYYYFKDAWLEYQLVAWNKDREVIGRTQIYDRNLSLVMCRPIP